MNQTLPLPPRLFDIYDEVRIYRTELASRATGILKRTRPTGESGTVKGYAITDSGWEYFVTVLFVGNSDTSHSYNKWVREIGLERIGK